MYTADSGGLVSVDENTAVRENIVLGKTAWLWWFAGWLAKPSVGSCMFMLLVYENRGLTGYKAILIVDCSHQAAMGNFLRRPQIFSGAKPHLTARLTFVIFWSFFLSLNLNISILLLDTSTKLSEPLYKKYF